MYLLLLIAALIVYGSLFPWHFDFTTVYSNPLPWLLDSWPEQWDVFALRDATVNLCLYLPLGFAAFLALKRISARRRFPRAIAASLAIAAGFSLATGMEILQLYVPGRVASAFDIVCDTVGAAAGAFLAWRFESVFEALAPRAYRRFASSAAVVLACFAFYHLYPFFPMISMQRLQFEMTLLLHPNSILAIEIWASAAEWFAAMLAVQALLGRMRLGWLLAAVCFRLAVRPILITRPLGLEEVAAAALAALLWKTLPERMRVRAGLLLLVSTILFRALAPLNAPGIPPGFSWIPFKSVFGSDRQAAIAMLSRKTFEYSAILWLLYRSGISYTRAGALLAAALALWVAAQGHSPGKELSITDPVVAALLGVALGSTELYARRAGQQGSDEPLSAPDKRR